ncbi:MAG: beta-lactamase family protein [Alphaproteobacteria bacterium]|nr:beta-lactamase family protein [Alphaproteobacteria bacterium]MBU1526886.1 beta-lactamase family protein [Alphaproteobacteria bacterium]MBU2117719.1 beta-lactamase family protein [Alphaproteobacteria bacterium]MBU2351804.1 beta-lactamase family protein [Alphaproteobacteria bacterium]MBU2381444.1 beta-lactamase family protein [Alphaproteobacteria bacterium]
MTPFPPRPDRRAVLAGASALAALPAAASAADPRAYEDQLELSFSRSGAPALAGMIVGRSGATWVGVRGVRRLGVADPVTAADRWHLGSNTKAMTAALWARAVQAGKARWDMPLSEAFADLTLHERLAGATVDDLMRHRAGLLDAPLMEQGWLRTSRSDPRTLVEQRAAIASQLLAAAPPGRPGAFAYANVNYIIAGAALERLHGTAWEELMAADLFAPLGITTGGFGAPGDPAPWGHRASNGVSAPVAPGPMADNPAALGPAGTAHMTLADYARFLAVFLDGGKGWLTPASLARLATPFEGPGPAYAYGWGTMRAPWAGRDRGPGTLLTHDGSNTFWYLSAAVAPERGLAVVTASNDAGRGAGATGDLMTRLIRAATT